MKQSELDAIMSRNPALKLDDNPHKISNREPVTGLPDTEPKQHKAIEYVEANCGEKGSVLTPQVRFTLCRVHLLDQDAKVASVKDLLDGLQHAGLIFGDKEGEVEIEVRQEKVRHYEEERTRIDITYREQYITSHE